MLPSLFISHGSPMMALEKGPDQDFLRELGQRYLPRAILVISAHWETQDLQVSCSIQPETIHDFYGFPPALFACRYPAAGDPALAERVAQLTDARQVERGLDHGAWVPLMLMYPQADIPVVSLSLPSSWSAEQLHQLGQQLAPLREEGVLVLGSGSLTHNLRAIQWRAAHGEAADWVVAFADWVEAQLLSDQPQSLLAWQQQAPFARENHPTPEHFQPLLVALGAGKLPQKLYRSYSHGVLAMDVYGFF